jgi:hypothetical protein
MDDGSIKDRHSRAVVFHTQGFTQAEVARLAQTLTEKFALETYLRRQAEGHQVVIRGASLERFLELVEPYLIPEMRYKLPPAGRTQLTWGALMATSGANSAICWEVRPLTSSPLRA